MKSDSNAKEIVAALRAVGASVHHLDPRGTTIGRGLPDLLVGFKGRTCLMEVKRPVGPRGGTAGRKLRPSQEAFLRAWRGGPVFEVRSVGEALTAVGLEVAA